MKKIRVILADENLDMLSCIRHILSKADEIEIVAQVRFGLEAIKAVNKYKPDILVMDICLPDMHAHDVIRKLQDNNIPVRIVILSKYLLVQTILELLDLRINGYVANAEAVECLIPAVQVVMEGAVYLSPMVRELVPKTFSEEDILFS